MSVSDPARKHRILADENAPAELVRSLRADGHDVRWVREELRGIDDREVLRCAAEDRRILITFDKDFGALVFRDRIRIADVVLVRVGRSRPTEIIKRVRSWLNEARSSGHRFVVLEEDRIRAAELPHEL